MIYYQYLTGKDSIDSKLLSEEIHKLEIVPEESDYETGKFLLYQGDKLVDDQKSHVENLDDRVVSMCSIESCAVRILRSIVSKACYAEKLTLEMRKYEFAERRTIGELVRDPHYKVVLFCISGSLTVEYNGEEAKLQAGEKHTFKTGFEKDCVMSLSWDEKTEILLAQIPSSC